MPNSAGNDSIPRQGGVRLGGVRADFVANLGKRLAELRQHWDALLAAPGSPALRNEFRRHIHALSTRSRVLHFEAMAERLDRAERRLARAAASGGIDADDVELFDALFRELPELAWIEVGGSPPDASRSDSAPTKEQEEAPEAFSTPAFPLAVLVIGGPALADSLQANGIDPQGLAIDVEQTEQLDTALELTQALAPDVVVLDGDLAGATIVSETLARDPIAHATPVVVVGTWSHADQASDFLAHGVARALPKPVSPAKLRNAVREAFETQGPTEQDEDIGAVTIEALANRLAEQVRTGLVDAVRPESRRVSVDLGQGTEVLAAVWGAVARVREMLTIRSQGTIQFNHTGPIGAVPVAPWLDVKPSEQARRDAGRETEQDAKLLLEGRRVLVVDDDPAITWFLSGLFRAHGSSVREAQDGLRGLDIAFQFHPELVITDILMPKLDGFGLCRALKRDVVLRDVPVIVLSWKEDLLQRVRELGVGADGYLRKEATSGAILRTVQEALRPRTRIEERLRAGGEVRGRLDGLTARTLLTLVADTMPNACVNVRDARHLFEVQLREGKICDATRTSLTGTSVRGEEALISLVRVFTGRFQVLPAQDAVDASTTRPLHDIVATAVAEARAAQVLLEGANLLQVKRLALRPERLDLESLPKATRDVFDAIQRGTAPAQLIADGVVTAASLEQNLSDAASRGAIASIIDAEGTDLLVDESKLRLRAWMSPLEARPVQRDAKERTQSGSSRDGRSPDDPSESGVPSNPTVPCPADAIDGSEGTPCSSAVIESPQASIDLSSLTTEADSMSDAPPDSAAPVEGSSGAATSLTEAVIREVADEDAPSSQSSPSMLDVSELKPRSTARPEALSSLPSLPPDAIVPGAENPTIDPLEEVGEPSIPDVPSMPPPPKDMRAFAEDGGGPVLPDASEMGSTRDEQDDDEQDDDEQDDDEQDDDEQDDDEQDDDEQDDDEQDDDEQDDDEQDDDEQDDDEQDDDEQDDNNSQIPKRSLLFPILAAVGVGGGLITAAVYLGGSHSTPLSNPPAAATSEATGPSVPIPAPPESDRNAADAGATGMFSETGEKSYAGNIQQGLPIDGPGEAPPDQGLLEVRTGRRDAMVTIDGRDLGAGEVIRMFLGSGSHRVLVVWQGRQLRGEVSVEAAKKTRLSLGDAWEP